jgi:hypothetical protein
MLRQRLCVDVLCAVTLRRTALQGNRPGGAGDNVYSGRSSYSMLLCRDESHPLGMSDPLQRAGAVGAARRASWWSSHSIPSGAKPFKLMNTCRPRKLISLAPHHSEHRRQSLSARRHGMQLSFLTHALLSASSILA